MKEKFLQQIDLKMKSLRASSTHHRLMNEKKSPNQTGFLLLSIKI
jgi:hypothetical protein